MFLDDADTLQMFADALAQVGIGNLPPFLAGVNALAHARAFNEISTRLAARGFSVAQILAWDRGSEFESDLTIYFTLTRVGAQLALDQKFAATYDRLKELKHISLTTAGVFVAPASTTGQVSVGPESTVEQTWCYPGSDTHLSDGTQTKW